MRDRKLDRLFDRFRADGDAPALGKVFDATASELLQVAVHLVRDPGDAEDLLQATFLTAIERASSYDGDRRLVPWLIGIMVRHAHNLRRTKRREVEPDRLLAGVVAAPEDQLQADEFADSIQKALAGLSPSHQAVLEPFLLHGERAVDIARKSGVAPGTVRVQIRRGLIAFRRALPAGLAPGAVVLLGGRSLAEVRSVVLNSAAKHAGSASVASLSTTTLLAGFAVSQKVIVATVSTLLLVLVSWLAGAGDWLSPDLDDASASRESSLDMALLDDESLADASREMVLQTEREQPAEEARADRKAVAGGYDSFLAGVEGKVAYASGEPAAGMSVSLLEIRPSPLNPPKGAVFDSLADRLKRFADSNPVVAEVTAGADGSFRLPGAHLTGGHALGFDLGGKQPAWRILDSALRSGKITNVGTILLAETHAVRGHVIDELGQPVAGVRVRMAPVPEFLFSFADIREGSNVIFGRANKMATIELPPFAMSLMDLLPIPTTVTNEEGDYELLGVSPIGGSLVLDRQGFAPLRQMYSGTKANIGESVLARLGALRVRVLDMAGSPVVGAQIRGGPNVDVDLGAEALAVTSIDGLTDETGSFEFLGNLGSDLNSIAVRRSANSPWTFSNTVRDGATIRVLNEWSLRLRIEDSDGSGVADAELHVSSVQLSRNVRAFVSGPSLATAVERQSIGEGSPGDYTLGGLHSGAYALSIRAEGFAAASATIKLAEDWQSQTVTLERAEPRSVIVLDAKTGSPVTGAHVSFARSQNVFGATRTGHLGRAEVQGVPCEGQGEINLRVAHTGYATSIGKHARDSAEVTVRLDSGGGVLFRVLTAGEAPKTPIAIQLNSEIRGSSADSTFPLLALTDSVGEAALDRLMPGKYSYSVSNRFLNADPLHIIAGSFSPPTLAHGEIEVVAGESLVIPIDLGLSAPEPVAFGEAQGVRGVVRIQGRDTQGMAVMLYDPYNGPAGLQEEQTVDALGKFAFDDISPGKYMVLLLAPRMNGQLASIATEEVTVKFGRASQVDFELSEFVFTIEVTDSEGEPCNDAAIHLMPKRWGANTYPMAESIGNGLMQVTSWAAGEFEGTAESQTAGTAQFAVEITADGAPNQRVQLSRGAPCAGILSFPGGSMPGTNELHASWSGSGSQRLQLTRKMTFVEGVAPFDMVGFPPGTYSVHVGTEGGTIFSSEFELPGDGDGDLRLKLAPKQ